MGHLIVAAAIGLLYVAFCLARPAKPCRRCGGWGSRPGRRAQRRHCTRCDGTGRRFRVPARVIYAMRGAMRRHAWLTARAAKREEAQP